MGTDRVVRIAEAGGIPGGHQIQMMERQSMLIALVCLGIAYGAYDGIGGQWQSRQFDLTPEEEEQTAAWKDMFRNHQTADEDQRDILLEEALKVKEFAQRHLQRGEAMTNTKTVRRLGEPFDLVTRIEIEDDGADDGRETIVAEALRLEDG